MTALVFPHPDAIPWERWSTEVVGLNPILRNQITAPIAWQEYGRRLALVVPQAPRPDLFDTWQAWASALIRATAGS